MPDQQYQSQPSPSPFRAGLATGVAKVNLANVPRGILSAATIEAASTGLGALAGLVLPIPGGAVSGAVIGSQAAEAFLLYWYFQPLIEKGLVTLLDIFKLCSPLTTEQERERIWFRIGEHAGETALQLVLSRGIGQGLDRLRQSAARTTTPSMLPHPSTQKASENFSGDLSAHLNAALRSSRRNAITEVRSFVQGRGASSKQIIDGVEAFLKVSPPPSVLAGLRIAEIAPDDETFQQWLSQKLPGFARTLGGSGRDEREFFVTTQKGKTYWTLPISAALGVPANTSQEQIIEILRNTPVRLYAEWYFRARLKDLPPVFERGSQDYVTLLRRLNIERTTLRESSYMHFPEVAPGMSVFNETINRDYVLRCLLGEFNGPVRTPGPNAKHNRRYHALSPDQMGSVVMHSSGPLSLLETYAGSGYNMNLITRFARLMGVQIEPTATDNKSYDNPHRIAGACSITSTKFHDVISVPSYDENILPHMPRNSGMLTVWPCASNFKASNSLDEDVLRFPGKMFFLVPGGGWSDTSDAVISSDFETSVSKYISGGWRLKAIIPDGIPIDFGQHPFPPFGYLFVFERSP